MRTFFDQNDVKRALSKLSRVDESKIVLTADLPEFIASTDKVEMPASTGRKRGSKNAPAIDKRQTKLHLVIPPVDDAERQ